MNSIEQNEPTLTIVTDGDECITVTREDAPDLFAEWDRWVLTPRGSSAEGHNWNCVLSWADGYLEDTGDFGYAVDVTRSV